MAKDEATDRPPVEESVADRRTVDRYPVEWAVDCVASDTFLYASITNISELGIFVRTTEPLGVAGSGPAARGRREAPPQTSLGAFAAPKRRCPRHGSWARTRSWYAKSRSATARPSPSRAWARTSPQGSTMRLLP